jgi:hypothetical protein
MFDRLFHFGVVQGALLILSRVPDRNRSGRDRMRSATAVSRPSAHRGFWRPRYPASPSRGEGPIWRRTKVVAGSMAGLNGAVHKASLYFASCPAKAGHPVITSTGMKLKRCGVLDRPVKPDDDRVCCCRSLFISLRMCLVRGLIHQAAEFALVCDFQFEKPGLAGGVRID